MSDKERKILTLEEVKQAIPSRRRAVTQELVDIINDSTHEAEFQGESLIDSMATYEKVMSGRSGVSVTDYVHALKFCAYLVTFEDNYTEAYRKTFRNRPFVKERAGVKTDSDKYKELTTAASRYRRSKLVVDILTVSQVPLHMLFTGGRYKVLGILLDRAENSKLDRDKIAASKEFLLATKGPDDLRIELDVGIKENTATQNLMEQLGGIAARQKTLVEAGMMSVDDCGSLQPVERVDDLEGEPVARLINEGTNNE